MGTSGDSRVGQLVTRTEPKRSVRIQTQSYPRPKLHEDPTTRDTTQQHNNRVGALILHLWAPAEHPQYTGTHHDGKGCGWPDTTTSFTTHHCAPSIFPTITFGFEIDFPFKTFFSPLFSFCHFLICFFFHFASFWHVFDMFFYLQWGLRCTWQVFFLANITEGSLRISQDFLYTACGGLWDAALRPQVSSAHLMLDVRVVGSALCFHALPPRRTRRQFDASMCEKSCEKKEPQKRKQQPRKNTKQKR